MEFGHHHQSNVIWKNATGSTHWQSSEKAALDHTTFGGHVSIQLGSIAVQYRISLMNSMGLLYYERTNNNSE